MRSTPILDSLHFLVGETPDHASLGAAAIAFVLAYAALLLGSIAIAAVVLAQRPEQRNIRSATIWLARLLIGTMWFQGSLWKLPLPVAGGFQYWTGQLAEHAAYSWHAELVRTVLLPNIALLDPAVWVFETAMAVALMLGFGVRIAGVLGVLFMGNLWLGLYRNAAEWPWNYVFGALVHWFFVLDDAGRSLGLAALRWPGRARRP